LITLVEEGKREGRPESLKVKLPYSNDDFSVPENVYIIGTMNTADRSVEALDTALRRRFSFTELMPDPDLLTQTIGGVHLSKLLSTMNERIEALLDRDHAIGHSFFYQLKNDDVAGLRGVFRNSIIPLLKEYFYGDYGKIALVLGKGFVEVEKNPARVKFAIDPKDYDGTGDFTTPKYVVKEIDHEFDVVEAIKLLVPNEPLVRTPSLN
jgi:5-methylcytosine-specific restriction endonuclease McrBC GTP-binding regulatory subunit McrB